MAADPWMQGAARQGGPCWKHGRLRRVVILRHGTRSGGRGGRGISHLAQMAPSAVAVEGVVAAPGARMRAMQAYDDRPAALRIDRERPRHTSLVAAHPAQAPRRAQDR